MKHLWFPHLVGSAAPNERPPGNTVAATPLGVSDPEPLAIHEPREQNGDTNPLRDPLPQQKENIPSRLPRGERRRLRRQWERRRSQAKGRQFLAPLAAG